MWWLILIITTVIGLIVFYKVDEDLGGGIATLPFCILLILWVMSLGGQEVIREYEVKQYDIQGLENNIVTNQHTSGAFILGFGYINSNSRDEMKYYYFRVNDIGKKLETIEVDEDSDVYIRETDEMEPCLIYRYQETANTGLFKWLFGKGEYKNQIAEILVVPSNTIKIEYDVEI